MSKLENIVKEQASELNWLRFFYDRADFGPADEDIRDSIKQDFKDQTGLSLPEGYDYTDE